MSPRAEIRGRGLAVFLAAALAAGCNCDPGAGGEDGGTGGGAQGGGSQGGSGGGTAGQGGGGGTGGGGVSGGGGGGGSSVGSGSLDPSFGVDGKAQLLFGGSGTGMAVQADGKVVLVGGTFAAFQAARFLVDGGLDPGFGDGGTVVTTILPLRQQQARAVVLQSSGKVVVVGEYRPGQPNHDFDFTLLRYHPDGTLDSSFGDGGVVTNTGVTGRAFAVVVQPDDKLVLAGDETGSQAIRVARFNADGTLDRGFGDGGSATVALPGVACQGNTVAFTPDGGLLVSGDPIGQLDQPTTVVRLTAQGQLEPGFGDGGTLTLPGLHVGAGLAVQPDGKAVLVGDVETSTQPTITTPRFAVLRLLPDGRPDPGFGDAGVVITALKSDGDRARAVAVQPDGRLLVAGVAGLLNTDFGLVRYLPDGQLDLGFGAGGKVVVDFQFLKDGAEHVALLPGGAILLGGYATSSSRTGYAVTRLLP